MADTARKVMEEVAENITETVKNGTSGRTPATPEGMLIAYGSLLFMALAPIYFGSFRSLRFVKKQEESGKKLENSISRKDAMLFPLIASFALVSLYVVYKLVPKEYITVLLMSYFFVLGVLALAHIVSPYLSKLIPETDFLPNIPYHLLFTRGEVEEKEDLIDVKFTTFDIVSVGVCGLVGLLHLYTKHWITNNIFGLAFCINGIEIIHLSSFKVGAMLLSGLFFYDIFWVFKTDVMVTVAKNVEAPIKLMFPQDLLEKGIMADNCAMLGLGDIVIPGIFVALLLRYDHSRKPNGSLYFHTAFIAYIAGLFVTIFVMHVFKHAQPALLYLVPACLLAPLLVALIRGDISGLISYDEEHLVAKESDKPTKADKKD
jgi:minor histocompatibility antigen H13